MLSWILGIFLTGLAILVIAAILPGVEIKSYKTAIWVGLLIGIFNATLGWILRILAFPFNWLTLGLINFLIYVGIIMLVDKVVKKFEIHGFLWAVAFAVLLSLCDMGIDKLLA